MSTSEPVALLMNLRQDLTGARDAAQTYLARARNWFMEFALWKKLLFLAVPVAYVIVHMLASKYYSGLVHKMVEVADHWASWGLRGKLLLFMLVVTVSFPPVIGYSALSLLAGMVYGFAGWPIIASATVLGSTLSYLLCRRWLQPYAVWCMQRNVKLKVFVSALNDEKAPYWQNFGLMCLVRLCPLPYSLSNGALAAIPTLEPSIYVGATAAVSPKLFVPIFSGYQLRKMMQDGRSPGRQTVDFLGMVIAPLSFAAVIYVIYNRVSRKLESHEIDELSDLGLENA
ncbi:hypothetical protein KL911_001655 [Ogataea haglerorum]|uniref:uncharacterized protein n=1 Tax=Ogataea haglerorum TaxID=1937702 RepID=UPI001C88FFF0|nr:uncharacterized protein KL911_001655 [Ogataea haglerorum]KAG7755598.1 hypothetical protein KL911_001655 [Ogataea haglerorum]